MLAGPKQCVDTRAFANTVGVRTDVQQDGSEFQGFFLHGHGGLGSRLEGHTAGQLTKQLFESTTASVMRCECGHESRR